LSFSIFYCCEIRQGPFCLLAFRYWHIENKEKAKSENIGKSNI